MTVPRFAALKQQGRRLTMLTAYDYPTAAAVDAAGVEGILVGDTLGMVVQGRETTIPVTLDQVIYHAEMVVRAVRQALVVVDMPFGTYQLGVTAAVESAARIMKETGAPAVKLEGGEEQADTIAALVSAGIPVMAHVGLRPQSVHQLGGYRIQRDEDRLLADARAAQNAGAFAIVLECIPVDLAARITADLQIPTIGIGAGNQCDGQVLVLHDMAGLTAGRVPRFVKQYAQVGEQLAQAARQFRDEVRDGAFPAAEHSYQ